MDPFCNQGSFFSSTFSLSCLFSPSLSLSIRLSFSCALVLRETYVAIVLKMPVWHPQVTAVYAVHKAKICSRPHKLTLSSLDKSNPDPIIHIRIGTWVGQSYWYHESEQKFHMTHSQVHLTLNELELLVAAWCSSLWLSALCAYVCKWIMSWSEVTGYGMQFLLSSRV